ncbi:bZIP transcription factor family protein [Hibiscus syriacus]|uniref:Growth-regulating factor n=1 Tax=Hibiscus syriacus TaxID=106335 RepID=A0A6A3CH69_HIBSY|nr:bZIP transcription factor family protein [Hibiscus syriacus]
MDYGVVGLEGFVGSEAITSLASDPQTKSKPYGTGFLKQDRSGNNEDAWWRSSKLAKLDESSSASEAMLLHHRNTLFRSNATSIFSDGHQQQRMLSFSAPKSEALQVDGSYFHLTSPAYTINTGYNTGGFNGANMHGILGGERGPFTPSQWMELGHQALIYKYINSNVPIPSNLLIPIRKALDSADFSSLSGGSLRPNTLRWGAIHLGFSNNTDPEPGRCRRTDGKKWRCSRDVVADQKYCERHMNRGRHRSRKPVESKSGHSAAATATTTSKLMPAVSSSSASVVVSVSGSSESNSLTVAQQQFKNLQAMAVPVNRLLVNKETLGGILHESAPGLSMISPNINLKFKENPFLIPKQQSISYEENSRNEFGVVSSDSFLTPSHKDSSLINCRNLGSQDLTRQATELQHSLHEFMDDWPKCQSDHSAISWPEVDVKSDMTQLSISIPTAASDFMSSTSSPNEKLSPSPLRLSREFELVHMGLGVGCVINESNQRQASCIPISWENSMGGPLGEVLHSNNSSALNLMTEDGWG